MTESVTVAIDGPAGAGKSTVARAVASRLGVVHVDTGATYRLVALQALREPVSLDDDLALAELASRVAMVCELGPKGELLFVGTPVGDEIRDIAVGEAASRVAAVPAVRDVLVELQRRLVPQDGAVLEGRDIGTVVLPDADVKIYLDASDEVRAARRAAELGTSAEDTLAALRERDSRDAGREASPMRPSDEALQMDTSEHTPEQVVEWVLEAVRNASVPKPAPVVPSEAEAARSPREDTRRADAAALVRDSVRERVLWAVVRVFAYCVLRFAFRLERRGTAHIPSQGAAIIAANHRSLLDIPVVAMLTRRKVWFMGKEELFQTRLLGGFLSALGGFPVRRGKPDRRALNVALALLERGELVGVYPEGTRTPDGRFDELQDGLAWLALRSGAPVIPVGLSGTEAVFPPGRRLPQPARIRTLVGEPVRLDRPGTSIVARSRIQSATQELQASLRTVIDALETSR